MTTLDKKMLEIDPNDEIEKRYFKPADSILDGFVAINLTEDIRLTVYGATLHAGIYHMRIKDINAWKNREAGTPVLYTLSFDFDELLRQQDELVDSGILKKVVAKDGSSFSYETTNEQDFEISFKGEIISIKPQKSKAPLTYGEALTWALIQEARRLGDEELARKLFSVSYRAGAITEDEEAPQLPSQDVVPVVDHVSGVSKVSNQIAELQNNQAYELLVGGKNEKNVKTRVQLSYGGDDVSLSKPITLYDREVHDAVASIWRAGNKIFTTAQVFRTMTGQDGASKPSKTSLNKIEASLDKQRRTFVTLDYTKEARGREMEFENEKVTSFKHETYMLEADKVDIRTAKGNKASGYIIKDAPILYRHDATTKQLTTYPQALLTATSRVTNNTPRNLLIRSYLLKRISGMNNKNNLYSYQIQYSSIYKATGESNLNRVQLQRIRDTVKTYLDAFVSEGVIKEWSEYTSKDDSKTARKVTGVSISLVNQ